MNNCHKDMGSLADYYDWLYEDWTADIELYEHLAQGKEQLLECGIGTGRVAIPLARRGFSIVGFDHSPDMLRVARDKLSHEAPSTQKRIKLVLADMRSFDLSTTFDFIYIPLESFNHLLTLQDQLAALGCIKRHLRPDGLLVMDLFSPSHFQKWISTNQEIKWRLAKRKPGSNEMIIQTRHTTIDVAKQVISQHRIFDVFNGDGHLTRTILIEWECRIFFRGELELLLERAGFHLINLYGNYSQQPYASDSDIMICIAKLLQG